MSERATYKSEKRGYVINSDRFFDLVSSLENYISNQADLNSSDTKLITMPTKKDRVLLIKTGVVSNNKTSRKVTLAEVVCDEQNNAVKIFKVHSHNQLKIDPQELYDLGERYKIR